MARGRLFGRRRSSTNRAYLALHQAMRAKVMSGLGGEKKNGAWSAVVRTVFRMGCTTCCTTAKIHDLNNASVS